MATTFAMTPPFLIQLWNSYGGSGRVSSLSSFSQRDKSHPFSNYAVHPHVVMFLPRVCNHLAPARGTKISFDFAEKAIMACKAALFGDDQIFDQILKTNAPAEAKKLGRQVSNFSQQVWDQHQCTIVREVMLAKLQWSTFRLALLRTGNDTIAECTPGDWVWGTALDLTDPNIFYPGRWKGRNILGWSLQEARAEALHQQQRQQQQMQQQMQQFHQHQQQQQQQQHQQSYFFNTIDRTTVPVPVPFAPSAPPAYTIGDDISVPVPSAPSAPPAQTIDNTIGNDAPVPSAPSAPPAYMDDDSKMNSNKHSIKHLATLYSFGPNAFGALHRSNQTPNDSTAIPNLSHAIKQMVEASFPQAKQMRGERGRKFVTKMLEDIYDRGLFMHGSATSSVNRTIVPAVRHIVHELNQLNVQDKKRISIVQDLCEACQDCQQVQARVILRIYGDLTSQNETFESQLQYSLVRAKEAALQVLITKYHAPSCDLDHTKVAPAHQRAHLWSGYVSLIGSEFGLDGITAANGDRFLTESLTVIREAHKKNAINNPKRFRLDPNNNNNDQKLQAFLLAELKEHMSVQEWLSGLLGDINNQSATADRRIDRSCIFAWATDNMQGDFKHRIFYDDARSDEYSDLDPNQPTQDNQFEPFLSPMVLVEMLVQMRMLAPKP